MSVTAVRSYAAQAERELRGGGESTDLSLADYLGVLPPHIIALILAERGATDLFAALSAALVALDPFIAIHDAADDPRARTALMWSKNLADSLYRLLERLDNGDVGQHDVVAAVVALLRAGAVGTLIDAMTKRAHDPWQKAVVQRLMLIVGTLVKVRERRVPRHCACALLRILSSAPCIS